MGVAKGVFGALGGPMAEFKRSCAPCAWAETRFDLGTPKLGLGFLFSKRNGWLFGPGERWARGWQGKHGGCEGGV